MTKFTHKMVAALAAGTLAIAGAGLVPAQAQVDPASNTYAQLIDANETGTLHIHKYSNNTPGAAGTGTEISDTGSLGEPLSGATFRVRQVTNVDLTTNAGWQTAQAIANGDETPTYGAAQTVTTDGDGNASLSDLPLGLYYVEETAAPAGHTASAEPFYVTLPMTDPTNQEEWMYEVHVYPKNAVQEDIVTKTVNDANAIMAGDDIDFAVTVKLPSVEKLEDAEITDIYPAGRLENPTVQSVQLGNGQTVPEANYTVDNGTAGQSKVIFNEAGRAQLDALTGEDRTVTVNYRFQVAADVTQSSTDTVTNRAMVYTRGEGQDITPPNPDDTDDPRVIPPGSEDETKTYYGNVQVNKTSPQGDALEGVEFDLYRCNEGDGSDGSLNEEYLLARALSTDSNGQLTINGLHVNDFVNGAVAETDPTGYCLVEVKTAEGYSLLAEPAYFQVLRGANTASVDLTSVNIENVEDNAGFNLPFTGGDGVKLLLIIGGLIIVIGGGYAYVANRRQA